VVPASEICRSGEQYEWPQEESHEAVDQRSHDLIGSMIGKTRGFLNAIASLSKTKPIERLVPNPPGDATSGVDTDCDGQRPGSSACKGRARKDLPLYHDREPALAPMEIGRMGEDTIPLQDPNRDPV
jgi:hypothetical protein